jgi:REP element-mobilizing transposase RayT
MDRVWLLTWTTYGQWLPGDSRGSVPRVHDTPGPRRRPNIPGTPPAPALPGIQRWARDHLSGAAVRLTRPQARTLIAQLRETAEIRRWSLLAVAIMANHVHVVVGLDGDPDPSTVLRDFKGWGSRRLSREYGKPEGGTWWTASASTRRLRTEENVIAAVKYVREQAYPLLVWAPKFPPDDAGMS